MRTGLLWGLLFSLLFSQSGEDVGLAYFKNEEFDQARSYYENVLRSDPDNSAAWFGLGVTAFQSGDLETATRAFTTVVEQDDAELKAEALYNLGHVAYSQQQPQAIEYFKRALALNPTDQDTRFNYEFLKYRQGQSQQDDKSNPPEPSDHAKAVKKQAEELVKQGRYPEAMALMNDLLQNDPTAVSYGEFVQKIQEVYSIYTGR
ncbi:MAG: tetratricopeptide repeat protein [Fidelibacterota bacterium]